ncbi:hypothetical protein PC39_07204 [Salinisphaera sp. PC39]|uniref:cupin domain-containing protein n=1 Tax=Salinisphaera sp. PC39 TaxID=1304156 RepID=UPI0033417224
MKHETSRTRADELIRELDLEPHPEGGHFRRHYAATATVEPADGRGTRPALTSIYYLLRPGEIGRWHRVRSDEAWHFYEGTPLELLMMPPDMTDVRQRRLGPPGVDTRPAAVVPVGWWQAARPADGFALVGCSVGPGFDFADFELLRDRPAEAAALRERHPDLAGLI